MAVETDLTLGSTASQLRELARRAGVAGFWGWWIDQLAGLVPAGPRAAWQRRRMRPVLAFDAGHATLWRPVVRDGAITMDAQATIPLDGDASDVVNAGRQALGAHADGSSAPVTLALPPRTVLRKQLTLPLAVEENLRQVVAYDLDRHTPFKADELYFDARIVDRNPARGTLHVDLAAARRLAVDPLLRHAESWGATVKAISAEPPRLAATSSLNLLSPEFRNGRAPWRRWQFWLPIALLALFALGATVLPLWQKREYAIALLHDTEIARSQAAVSETLRAELERQVSDYNFALERKFAFAPTVQILDDVTRLLPDDTWLTQLEVRTSRTKDTQRELSLRGESANAGRLVSVLEESKLFTQAAPRSPITKIQPGPGEIFDVGAQLKPLVPPQGAPIVIASAKPAVPGTPPPAAPTAAPAAPPATTPPVPPSSASPAVPPAAKSSTGAAAAPAASAPPAAAPGPSMSTDAADADMEGAPGEDPPLAPPPAAAAPPPPARSASRATDAAPGANAPPGAPQTTRPRKPRAAASAAGAQQ